MEDMGIVYGSAEQAKPLIVGIDTVYVHTDIEVVEDDPNTFKYHEVQYGKDEYIAYIASQNRELEKQTEDLQLALTELFETVGGDEL